MPIKTIVDVNDATEVVYRAQLKDTDDYAAWLKAYESATHTHWNVHKMYPASQKLFTEKTLYVNILIL